MLARSTLDNYINENKNDLTKNELLELIHYFEIASIQGYEKASENIDESI